MNEMIRYISSKYRPANTSQLMQGTSGYTLFELIVALQLGFIIIGMIYLAYNQFQQQTERWQNKINQESTLSQLSYALSLTIDSAEKILLATPDKFIFQPREGDSITIELRDNIYINQRPLLRAVEVSLKKGHFNYYDENLTNEALFFASKDYHRIRALAVKLQLKADIGLIQQNFFFQLPANH